MRVFFDNEQKIIGVYEDDADVNFVGAYEISVPRRLTKKLDKTIKVARQKHTPTGDALFVDAKGIMTTAATTKYVENTPVMEEIYYTRPVSLMDAPYEWSVLDVLTAKYELMAFDRNYWFEEFLTSDMVDFSASLVNSGVFSLSVPPQGVAQLKPVQLSKPIASLELYLEGADDLTVEVSGDGTTFSKVSAGLVNFSSTDTLTFRFTNPAESGVAIAIDAIAVFY